MDRDYARQKLIGAKVLSVDFTTYDEAIARIMIEKDGHYYLLNGSQMTEAPESYIIEAYDVSAREVL